MNQTGVASTGSTPAGAEEPIVHAETRVVGERDQIFEPERLEPDRRAERLAARAGWARQEVVAGDDRDRHVDEMRLRPNQPEELQAVGDRHPHVEDDGVRADVVGKLQPCLGATARWRPRNPSSLSIRANVSATDRSSSTIRIVRVAGFGGMAFGRGNHRIILMAKDMRRQGVRCLVASVPGYTGLAAGQRRSIIGPLQACFR